MGDGEDRTLNPFLGGHPRARPDGNTSMGGHPDGLAHPNSHLAELNTKLVRQDHLFQFFIESVRDYAIFMLDPEGRIMTWNVGAARIKGYAAEEIVGQPFSIFFPEEDVLAGKPERELQVAARDGRMEDEGWRVRKDGSRFWANVIITAVRNEHGDLAGFCKVTRDYTDQMRTRKSLENALMRLEESEQSLRELSLSLLRTHDEERRLLGREMHDSLGQFLVVLKMKLDSIGAAKFTGDEAAMRLRGDDCIKRVAECSEIVERCIREVQTVSYLLYPPMLDELGLKSAIAWYLDGFSKRSGIQANFQAPRDLQRLPRDVELALFRVLQESLTNIHKHSGSPTAQVRIVSAADSVVLEVSDRGKGLPSSVLEESEKEWSGSMGVGLRGMNERLRHLNGKLHITSGPAGTRLQAVIPISPNVKHQQPS
jgi:PAS domain S-box-containing protein